MSKLYNKVFKKQQAFVTTLKHNTCKSSHHLLMKNVLVLSVCVLGGGGLILLGGCISWLLRRLRELFSMRYALQIFVLHVLGTGWVSIYRLVNA